MDAEIFQQMFSNLVKQTIYYNLLLVMHVAQITRRDIVMKKKTNTNADI